MRLTLFYRRVPLGVLEKNENGYAYTSYIENEETTRGFLHDYQYGLRGSFKRESRKPFPVFEEILENCSRKDIQERANINPKDSKWEKLVKYSQLNWFTPNFYVQQTGDTEEESKHHLVSETRQSEPHVKTEPPVW
jgi:hypothetical protein